MKTRIFLLMAITMLVLGMNVQARSSAGKKILVAYFSQSGNTQEIANQIKNVTGADVFVIQPAIAYPSDYQTLVDQAKKEVNAGYKPALKGKADNIGSYDVIFVGSPNWWSTIAPPVATFLSQNDFSGKTIVPFITHEGSRMGRSVTDIKKLCPNSTILEGLPVRGSSVKSAQKDVDKWLKEIGVVK